ncbi:hypothetical protein OO009_08815 [Flavobacteriaceae bacterium KMM 6897]|nr:hypothetical protein [Flavobacteriaceae bacterium KMM 6897]MEB8347549.1 hypothetical protein [Flavobacteriaceae bacterium KMM 6898]
MKKKDKHSGFKTPEGYFEGLNNSLFDKLKGEDTIIPQNEGFTVPEGYFDGVNQTILSKIREEETKVIPLNPYKKYYFTAIAVAASLLLVIGLQWTKEEVYTFDDLAASEIESYFEYNDYGMSSYEIAEIMPIDDINIQDMLQKEIKDENIADYLNDNIDIFEDLNLEDNEY